MSEDSPKAPPRKPQNKSRDNTARKKRPKKITSTYLHNAGLYYLERFASSSANFREVMLRKVKRSCMVHTDQNYDECVEMVDKLVEKFISVGLLDDAVYTRSKVNALRRRGKSTRAIEGYLRSKGLDPHHITDALEHYNAEHHLSAKDVEYEAALTFARKKRIGPYRGDKEPDDQKELGRLARAGFSYDTSRRVLSINEDDLDLISI